MSLDRRHFMKLGLGACLLPIVGGVRSQPLVSERMYAFGTLVQVDVAASDPEAGRAAIATVGRDFVVQNREWHAWKPGALNAMNLALAAGQSHDVEPILLPLLLEAQALSRMSGGLFNPAIGRIVGRWGFHDDELPTGAPPAAEDLAVLRSPLPVMDDLHIDGQRVSSRNRLVQIDFGGYAKGVALDRALDRLAALGFGDALVNLGGNLAVAGTLGGRPWRIGVRHPQGGGALAAVEVSGRLAVVTSGTYERFREHGGQRYAHIIDPRDGRPARQLASVTVIHPNAALADAAATALVVAGPREWPAVARGMGVESVMLVDEAGRVQLTPHMAQRVRFVTRPVAVRTVATV